MMKLPIVKQRRQQGELQIAKDLLEYTVMYLCESYSENDEEISEIVNQISEYLYRGEED